ncbi:MAG: hypothetical protein AAF085_09020 [Planctomycetota bacterium]
MRKPIRQALREQQEQLAQQAYPGDLAKEVLEQSNTPNRWHLLLYPALATALLAIGLTIGIALLPSQEPEPTSPSLTAQPGPFQPVEQNQTPESPVAQTPAVQKPSPAIQVAKAPLPEIDRGLLPVRHNGTATWLASPKSHLTQIKKQSQLAANPDPSKRIRVSFYTPTRRSIDRTFSRTRSLKPNPKTERTT